MLDLIANCFGYIIKGIYQIVNNYGLTIVIFTLFTKIILFPINIIIQKNSIKMIKIKPKIEELKIKYANDKEQFMEEQIELFEKENYKPSLGVVPLLIQIPIILGLIRVIGNTNQYIQNISNTFFLGIDLEVIPTLRENIIIPILAALSTIMLCFFQNRANVLQKEESLISKLFTGGLTIGITVYFVFLVPAGVGLYWILGNIIAIIQLYILNWMIPPEKYVDYDALNRIKEIKNAKKQKEKIEKKRSKEDYKKFFDEDNINDMKLMFYSEKSGFYKYFRGIIEYILNNSDIVIHYVTSDINDDIFNKTSDRLKAYFINTTQLIPLFMKIEADVVVMTTPDLQNMYLKRSIVRKDVEYIMVPHGISSDNLVLKAGALDNYDTIFVNGEYSVREIRQIEKLRGTKEKRIVKYGYCNLDDMIAGYKPKKNSTKTVLIAPSWQDDNILESCIDVLLNELLKTDYKIIFRPHPEMLKHKMNEISELEKKYSDKEQLIIQKEFKDNNTIYDADLLITDWSSIGMEYAFTTLKPVLYINTPIKALNKDYKKIDEVPLDIQIRDKIGKSVDLDKLYLVSDIAKELIESKDYSNTIEKIRNDTLYNIGTSAEVGGKYIIGRIKGENYE